MAIDPGSVAIGILSGLGGWAIFLFFILPRFGRNLKADIKKEIKTELPIILKDIAPIIKEEFKSEMPDFTALKIELRNEVETLIPSASDVIDEVMDSILIKMTDKEDETVKSVMAVISARVVGGAIAMIENDPDLKQWLGGMFSHYGGKLIERVEKMIEPYKKLAESYGIDPDNPEAGTDIDIEVLGKKAITGFLKKKGWID